GAVAETLKYSTKPADMVADPEWFLELTRQTHKRRFVATGGALKDVLKLEQETDQDMVIGDDISDGEDDGSRLAFGWDSTPRKYVRLPERDKFKSDPD
ncbi:protein rep, partial [Salmonella enterica subsp. enterica serovar Kentucky]|nr:protein rep [Salmonella enterica subsp. enterica serovar Kentucky]